MSVLAIALIAAISVAGDEEVSDFEFPIIVDNTVKVDGASITDETTLSGSLSFCGYMCQSDGFEDYTEAWGKVFAPKE